MLNFLYSLIIYPLYQIVELFYTLSYGIVKNQGLAIIGVSLTVSFLCLPLYIIAEKWQELERNIEAKLKPGVDRIKSVFKGDEQYMILSTFYKQNSYHPAMALRSSLSLLIQIPFFIAAYQFLSNLEPLNGFSFLFIKDMGAPDALFHIGNFPINVLPIAMTLINIGSGIVYSKGHPLKEKLQIYIMALFFLVFLYNSPSGLVFYWTLNNVFSLVKNIFYKFKKPLRALYWCLVAGVLLIDFYLIFFHSGFLYRRLILIGALCIIPLCPLIIKFLQYLFDKPLKNIVDDNKKTYCFILACIALSILIGYSIPSFLISSSPMEFSFVDDYDSPFFFIRNTLFQSFGFCIFWPCCIYFMFNNKVKTVITFIISSLLCCGLINAFVMGGDYGTISTVLTFTNAGLIKTSLLKSLLLAIPTIIIILILYFIFKFNKQKYLNFISIISIVSLLSISIINSVTISKGYKEAQQLTRTTTDSISPIFHLSKTEKNVIVIMQDRAISGFIPYIFDENKNLYDQFKGFTYYPNTASFGGMTLIGSPLVYGGYEYSPLEINKRKNETLIEKHNEALKVMPVMFTQNGFETTVTDLSWANYSWISDLSIFNDYPDINKKPVMRVYNDIWQKDHQEQSLLTPQSAQLKRNFIWFSFFKISTPALREIIYDEGNWWATKSSNEYVLDFLNSYSYLYYMNNLTDFEAKNPTFTLLVNETTHEPVNTGYPDYNLTSNDIGPNYLDDDEHYMSTAATLYKWGDFFEYLQKNDVYDNTRIIIVADHGGSSKLAYDHKEQGKNGDFDFYIDYFNPLLLVKDFNSEHPFESNECFMTNADTPYLASKDIISNPKNPFTGKLLQETIQKDKIYFVSDAYWSPDGHNKNTFKIDDSAWYSLKNDVRDYKNYKQELPIEE